MSGAVLLRHDDGVAWITLHRPGRLNALAGAMRDELADALEAAAAAPGCRAIVLTGAGSAFCAGADLDALADLLARDDAAGFEANLRAGMRVVRAVRAAPQPVLAAVNGVAAGAGAALAAACDLRLASGDARIGFTFARIGLHPDWGATWNLPRLVGAGRAAELIASGRMLDAAEALRIGLVERLAPAAGFAEAAAAWARELADAAPLALSGAKLSLAAAGGEGLESALAAEAAAQLACFRSADAREGVAAFRERRPARFAGR